jgi:predicted glycoside hydrolase/deacetylase ChbG (UPF0249 family)
MLRRMPGGVNEFVAHPGYSDDPELKRWSTYLEPRAREHAVLTDPAFRRAIAAANVSLIGYRDIPLRQKARRGALAEVAAARS